MTALQKVIHIGMRFHLVLHRNLHSGEVDCKVVKENQIIVLTGYLNERILQRRESVSSR